MTERRDGMARKSKAMRNRGSATLIVKMQILMVRDLKRAGEKLQDKEAGYEGNEEMEEDSDVESIHQGLEFFCHTRALIQFRVECLTHESQPHHLPIDRVVTGMPDCDITLVELAHGKDSVRESLKFWFVTQLDSAPIEKMLETDRGEHE